jgi:hypothetical protein
MVGRIDEKRSGFEAAFLGEFTQEEQCTFGSSRRKQPNVQQIVRGWIDRCVQPITLGPDLNHGLVDRNVIRTGIAGGL